jgi:hypothetical protein
LPDGHYTSNLPLDAVGQAILLFGMALGSTEGNENLQRPITLETAVRQ